MTITKLIQTILGVKSAKLENFEIDEAKMTIYVHLVPHKRHQCRCPHCRVKAPGYDTTSQLRQWRSVDVGPYKVIFTAAAVRVQCPVHGVVTASVPWADHDSRFTKAFEAEVAYLALNMTKSAVSKRMRIDWKTVGNILNRVSHVLQPDPAVRCENLVRIGIDETSYKKGHKYLTVITDHDTGQAVWCHENTGIEVLSSFFESLTREQRDSIEVVTCDGARWIKTCVDKYLPNADRCVDPFHVIQWVNDSLDEIRKARWRAAREHDKALPKGKPGRKPKGQKKSDKLAPTLKEAKLVLGKNPENLTARQQAKFKDIRENETVLFRAWQMKELLRGFFHTSMTEEELRMNLKGWIGWASRSRIPEMIELGKKIKRHMEAIVKTITLGVSNARIEAINNKIKVMIRMAYGFRNLENLKSMVLLGCSRLVDEIQPLHTLMKPGHEMTLGEWVMKQ